MVLSDFSGWFAPGKFGESRKQKAESGNGEPSAECGRRGRQGRLAETTQWDAVHGAQEGGLPTGKDSIKFVLYRRTPPDRLARVSLNRILAERLSAALAPAAPLELTPRDARLPALPGKAHAVIGMRRAGKTTFLRQLLAGRRADLPAERAIYLRIAPKVLLPGRGAQEALRDTLCQKSGYRGRNG